MEPPNETSLDEIEPSVMENFLQQFVAVTQKKTCRKKSSRDNHSYFFKKNDFIRKEFTHMEGHFFFPGSNEKILGKMKKIRNLCSHIFCN